MNKRIAVIGHHLSAVTQLADQLGQCCNVKVYRDQNDEMYELLKMNTQKFFSAYQIHVLLNRLMHSENENCIVCDTMFTDYGAVSAAMETGMITKAEFDIYESKQSECLENLKNYDAVIYLKSSSFSTGTSFDDLPLKYVIRCYEYFQQKLDKLQQQLQDHFLIIEEESIVTDSGNVLGLAKHLAMDIFDVKQQTEIKESSPIMPMKNQPQVRSISALRKIKEKLPYLTVVSSKDQIRALIDEYRFGKALSARLPCLFIDENDICTCLRIVMDDFGDESIECKEFGDVNDVIRFISEGEQSI